MRNSVHAYYGRTMKKDWRVTCAAAMSHLRLLMEIPEQHRVSGLRARVQRTVICASSDGIMRSEWTLMSEPGALH